MANSQLQAFSAELPINNVKENVCFAHFHFLLMSQTRQDTTRQDKATVIVNNNGLSASLFLSSVDLLLSQIPNKYTKK